MKKRIVATPTTPAPSNPPMVDPNPPTSGVVTDPEVWDDILNSGWDDVVIVP